MYMQDKPKTTTWCSLQMVPAHKSLPHRGLVQGIQLECRGKSTKSGGSPGVQEWRKLQAKSSEDALGKYIVFLH